VAADLDGIIRELDASYNPSRQSINDRIGALQGQEQADVAGLKGQQTEAFDGITQSAIGRGTFYGGAPIAEQQKYTATQFLPAVAQLKGKYISQRQSLGDALNDVNLDQRKTAMGVKQQRDAMEYQREQDALARADAQRARAEASSGGSSLSSLLGGGNPQQRQQQQAAPKTNPVQQAAYNDVFGRVQQQSDAQLKSDYKATMASAVRGNQKDKAKIDLYMQLRPDLFKTVNAGVLSNGSKLRF